MDYYRRPNPVQTKKIAVRNSMCSPNHAKQNPSFEALFYANVKYKRNDGDHGLVASSYITTFGNPSEHPGPFQESAYKNKICRYLEVSVGSSHASDVPGVPEVPTAARKFSRRKCLLRCTAVILVLLVCAAIPCILAYYSLKNQEVYQTTVELHVHVNDTFQTGMENTSSEVFQEYQYNFCHNFSASLSQTNGAILDSCEIRQLSKGSVIVKSLLVLITPGQPSDSDLSTILKEQNTSVVNWGDFAVYSIRTSLLKTEKYQNVSLVSYTCSAGTGWGVLPLNDTYPCKCNEFQLCKNGIATRLSCQSGFEFTLSDGSNCDIPSSSTYCGKRRYKDSTPNVKCTNIPTTGSTLVPSSAPTSIETHAHSAGISDASVTIFTDVATAHTSTAITGSSSLAGATTGFASTSTPSSTSSTSNSTDTSTLSSIMPSVAYSTTTSAPATSTDAKTISPVTIPTTTKTTLRLNTSPLSSVTIDASNISSASPSNTSVGIKTIPSSNYSFGISTPSKATNTATFSSTMLSTLITSTTTASTTSLPTSAIIDATTFSSSTLPPGATTTATGSTTDALSEISTASSYHTISPSLTRFSGTTSDSRESSETTPSTTTLMFDMTLLVNTSCNDTAATFLPRPDTYPSKCNQFFLCAFGRPVDRCCAPGLYFVNDKKVCDWPSSKNTHCAIMSAYDPRNTPDTTRIFMTATVCNITETQDTNMDNTTLTLPENVTSLLFTCDTKIANQNIPRFETYPNNCDLYTECVFGIAYNRSCAPGTYFTPYSFSQACDHVSSKYTYCAQRAAAQLIQIP